MGEAGERARPRARAAPSLSVLVTALFLAAAEARAGAWPKAPGEGQVILSTTYDTATRGFDAQGRLRDTVRYEKRELAAFVEYGLTRRFTFVGRVATQDVTIETPAGRERKSGMAASEAGLRAVLMQRDHDVLSVQASVAIPGNVENVLDMRLGEGGRDYEARLLYGRGFRLRGGHGFAEAQAGWRVRAGASPDEARLDLTMGWNSGRWLGLAQAFTLRGRGARPPRRNYDATKLQASIVRDIGGGMFVQAGAFRTVAGHSVVQENAAFAALWRRF